MCPYEHKSTQATSLPDGPENEIVQVLKEQYEKHPELDLTVNIPGRLALAGKDDNCLLLCSKTWPPATCELDYD